MSSTDSRRPAASYTILHSKHLHVCVAQQSVTSAQLQSCSVYIAQATGHACLNYATQHTTSMGVTEYCKQLLHQDLQQASTQHALLQLQHYSCSFSITHDCVHTNAMYSACHINRNMHSIELSHVHGCTGTDLPAQDVPICCHQIVALITLFVDACQTPGKARTTMFVLQAMPRGMSKLKPVDAQASHHTCSQPQYNRSSLAAVHAHVQLQGIFCPHVDAV